MSSKKNKRKIKGKFCRVVTYLTTIGSINKIMSFVLIFYPAKL